MVDFVIIMTMIVNPLCALMLLKLLLTRHQETGKYEMVLRVSVVFAISGLIGQAVHSFQTFTQGAEVFHDAGFWWVGKDLSIILLTFYLFFAPKNAIKIDDPKTS